MLQYKAAIKKEMVWDKINPVLQFVIIKYPFYSTSFQISCKK